MKLILNKELFYVEANEFPLYHHPIYTTLVLRPKLGLLEREIGLINDLAQSFPSYSANISFINYGLSHGGYLPLKVRVKRRYIISQAKKQLANFYLNQQQ